MYNVLLVLLATLGLTSCTIQGQGRFYPDRVRTVPPGFIALNPAIEELGEGVLSYLFWDTNIAFIDSENVTFFQTGVRNSEFIVMHGGEYYVNEEKFLELTVQAVDIYEQLNRTYSIGDLMKFRGRSDGTGGRIIHNFTIYSIDKNIVDDTSRYVIKFFTSLDISKDQALEFFYGAETENGSNHNYFAIVDDETVYIKLDSEDVLDTIILRLPNRLSAFVQQNSIRRVKVNR